MTSLSMSIRLLSQVSFPQMSLDAGVVYHDFGISTFAVTMRIAAYIDRMFDKVDERRKPW